MRGRAYRRHQRNRIRRKRFHIQYDCWHLGHEVAGPHNRPCNFGLDDRVRREAIARRLAKVNLACSCFMCAGDKRGDRRRDRHAARHTVRMEKP